MSKTPEHDTGFSSIDHESTKENVDEHFPIVLEGLINRRNRNFWALVLKIKKPFIWKIVLIFYSTYKKSFTKISGRRKLEKTLENCHSPEYGVEYRHFHMHGAQCGNW